MNALRAIARLRAAPWTLLGWLALGLASTQLTLLDVPGWELAELLTFAAVAIGGALGLRAARTALGRQFPARAALAAGAWTTLGVLGATAVVIAGALLRQRCSPWDGLVFVLLLPLPSALLASVLGCLLGRAIRRAWLAGLALGGLVVANVLLSLAPLQFGPQAFAYSHLLGWFPGPLYDELLTPPLALWLFRGLTVLGAIALLLWLSTLPAPRPARRLVAAVVASAAFVVGVCLEHRFGAVTSIEDLDRALGGRRATAHCVLHYPRELAAPEVERLARLAELDHQEDATALGVAGGPPVDIFLYRDAQEKGRLTGAFSTHFTKPWLHQIHTSADRDGRRVLRHELVHALAAPLGRGPFDVCARLLGVDVQAGIVEGLAMAVDWPAEELTLHQWSRAMREAGMAPDIRGIVGPAGFFAQSQGRAYTLAGSFLRYLLDRYGRDPIGRLYRDGDFQAAYGRPLDDLAREWESFVDAVPLDAEARGAAQNRFRQGSLFAKPCVREMADLRAQIDATAIPERRAELLGRCSAIDPNDPSLLKERWDAERAGELPGAGATLQALLSSPHLDPVLRAQIALAQGDEAVRAGDLAAARDDYRAVLAAHLDAPTKRRVQIMLAALDRAGGAAAPIVAGYFNPRGSPVASLLALLDLWQRDPGFAPAAYLVGLRSGDDGDRALGLRYLADAMKGELTGDERTEALRRSAAYEIDLGLFDAAEAHLARLAGQARAPADDVSRSDLERRLAFERTTYGGGIPGLR